MKVMIIGADGQLGTELCQVFRDSEVIPQTIRDIEITDMTSVKKSVYGCQPDIVINTAAFLRVDDCETEKDKAYAVNALGARNVAVICREIGAKVVYISTDYVFGGENRPAGAPYSEFDDPVPLNVYGRSKLAGEQLVSHLCHKYYIIRTSGLFGAAGASGKSGNFVETILKLSSQKNELTVVDDQVFSPTYALDLAAKIYEVLTTENFGIFHITNSGSCSWYEFSRAILDLSGKKATVTPVKSFQYPQKAVRPGYSVLKNYHLHLSGISALRPWQDALRDYLHKTGRISQETI